MNFTHPFLNESGDLDSDKLREECGVFGAINAPDASTVTALGLHPLQHRGQEAAGITSFDGDQFYSTRGTGHVAENFSSPEALAALPGFMAAGHVRYSTAGSKGQTAMRWRTTGSLPNPLALSHATSSSRSRRTRPGGNPSICGNRGATSSVSSRLSGDRIPACFPMA